MLNLKTSFPTYLYETLLYNLCELCMFTISRWKLFVERGILAADLFRNNKLIIENATCAILALKYAGLRIMKALITVETDLDTGQEVSYMTEKQIE